MAVTGIVVLAHGSRGQLGKGEVELVLKKITSKIKLLLTKDVEITGAALQFNTPNLEEAVTSMIDRGIKRIVLAPYFLFPGRHITEDIPERISSLQTKYRHIEFIVTDNLGLDDAFICLLARRIKEKVPDLIPRSKTFQKNPIEEESMKIIENLVSFPESLSKDEITVIKRIIHASGDTSIYQLVRFHDSAISAGIEAISRGCTIFTDVHMVKSGINTNLAETFGCSISCILDEAITSESKYETRAATAINEIGSQLQGGIIVIGNAPTALRTLLDLVNNNHIAPALIIGMPVGFVKAAESKQELMKHNIPYITIEGTRGGSPMAAATTNALLRIAAHRYQKGQY